MPHLLLALLAAWAPQQPQVAGMVRSGSLPIPGVAVVAVQGQRKLVTSSDESGYYEFRDLAAGAWSFEVSMVGFMPDRREIVVSASPTKADWNLELRAASAAAPAGRNGRRGFENLVVTQTVENQVLAALNNAPSSEPPAAADSSNANEAFLMNGSLSRGLQQVREEDVFAQRRAQFEQQRQNPFESQGSEPSPGFAMGRPGPFGPGGPRGGGFGGPGARMAGGPGPGGPFGGPFGNRAGGGRGGIRGAVFFNLDNSALDARPYSLTGQTVEKPSYAQSRFGVVVGGPLNLPKLIHSPRTFFFVSYFGTRARNPYQAVTTVPPTAEREGYLPDTVALIDPATRMPFPGNRIPAARIDPAAGGLLAFIPLPNQPGNVQNYQFISSFANNSDNLGVRLNRPLSRKDRLDVSFNLQSRSGQSLQPFGYRDTNDGRGVNLNVGWTRNFTTHTINTLRWSFSRNRTRTLPFFAYGENVAAELGISGVSQDPVNYGPPNLSFTNFGDLTDASPLLQRNQTSSLNEGLTLVRGAHTVAMGVEYRRMQLNTRTDQNARGTFTFTGLATSVFDSQGQPLPGTGMDFADFLLGLPQSSSVRFGDSSTYFRAGAYSGYLQDDWRVRSNLTVNLGLRYEFFTPYHEKYGHIANLDIAPGFTAVAVVTPDTDGPYTGGFPKGLIDRDPNNFSPRLGIAWRPMRDRQLQVRAGYGLFHNGSIYNQFPPRLAAQPPFANTSTLVTTLERPLTLQDGFALAPSQSITNTYAVDRDYRVGYAQTWSLSIQQNLLRSFVIELGYLGTKGTRLDIQRLPNRAAPGSPLTAEERRRIGNAVGFTFDTSDGNSIYHAAQVRLTRRFSRGISMNALYTFSKSIDNASTLGGGAAVVAQNDLDLHAERGLSSFDRRHNLNLSYVLTSPAGDRGHGWRRRLLKDWTLSGGLTASSGTPFTARVLGNLSDTGGTGAIGSGRADSTGARVDSGDGFFSPSAFTTPPPGRFGNAGRNTIPGPARVALNLSFGRAFPLDERRRLELRMDSQNVTNYVTFTGLGTVVNAINYGLATATQPMRTITATARLRF